MKNLKRISLLMAKVILVGTIFYPISLFYPDLQWHFSFMECVRMLLGYSGNYEWWFLRPYLIIAALIPLPLERNQQEIGNLPDYIIAAVFFDKIFNLFS